MKVLVLAALLTAACSAPAGLPSAPPMAAPVAAPVVVPAMQPARAALPGVPAERGRVTKVVDGDTLHVTTATGVDLDVRVIGEDSPETKKPRTPVQCWGPEASAEAHRVLDGQSVLLRIDPGQGGPEHADHYGRPLRYVTLPGGEDLSLHMVTGGWSRAYKVSGRVPLLWPDLLRAEGAARAAGRGLWGAPCRGGV